MTLDYFIQELKKSEPSEKLMIANGFESMPTSIMRCYNPEKKNFINLEDNIDSNILSLLFNQYDVQYFRFGDFSFQNKIKMSDGLYTFCLSSGTFLAFKDNDGEIIEYDCDEFSRGSFCAKDATSFLKALLHVFKLQSLRFQGLIQMDDEKINDEFFRKCVQEAGGEKYSRFFRQIIF